jgi:hypothetical protein
MGWRRGTSTITGKGKDRQVHSRNLGKWQGGDWWPQFLCTLSLLLLPHENQAHEADLQDSFTISEITFSSPPTFFVFPHHFRIIHRIIGSVIAQKICGPHRFNKTWLSQEKFSKCQMIYKKIFNSFIDPSEMVTT